MKSWRWQWSAMDHTMGAVPEPPTPMGWSGSELQDELDPHSGMLWSRATGWENPGVAKDYSLPKKWQDSPTLIWAWKTGIPPTPQKGGVCYYQSHASLLLPSHAPIWLTGVVITKGLSLIFPIPSSFECKFALDAKWTQIKNCQV